MVSYYNRYKDDPTHFPLRDAITKDVEEARINALVVFGKCCSIFELDLS